MMNDLIRRMSHVGITRAASRGVVVYRVGGVGEAQSSRLMSTSTALSSSPRPLWLSAVQLPQRFQFSTEVAVAPDTSSVKTSTIFTDEVTGQRYGMLLDTRKLPKLKPSIVKRRLDKCQIYIGREKSIRQSPWKLNRICQLAAGLTLEEAMTQLQFCSLKNADLVSKVLKRTSNLADIRHGIQMSQLEVAECFTTKSMMLRRIKPMGRGRHGVMHHKFSHIRVVLREIDFPLRIYQAKSLNQKKKWLQHQQRADRDGETAKVKRDEMQRLERQQEEQAQEREAAGNK